MIKRTFVTVLAYLVVVQGCLGQQQGIDPHAEMLWKEASSYLAAAKCFSVHVEVCRDVVSQSGQKIQSIRGIQVHLARPNRLRINTHSSVEKRTFWLNDKNLTVMDHDTNLYGVMSVPETIDDAIDAVEDDFGIFIPVADVLAADPYKNVMSRALTATYAGVVNVRGVKCRQLAFTAQHADFQIWIADGAAPLIQKIVIDLKEERGSPQITQAFSNWDLITPLSDGVFSFTSPSGAEKIQVIPLSQQHAPSPPALPEK